MTESKILSSIEFATKYLKMLEMTYDLNYKAKTISPSKFSEKYYFQSNKSANYQDIYNIALENNDYDILIIDDQSFFQFSAEKKIIKFIKSGMLFFHLISLILIIILFRKNLVKTNQWKNYIVIF